MRRTIDSKSFECCIIGAGPAGLGAALELTENGVTDILIIDRNDIVGGLSRTKVYDGVRFDIGPHRFFTRSKEINKLWHNILGNDFISVDRLTRIYFKNNYFNYPIKAIDTLVKLGPIESLQAIISFAAAKVGTKVYPENFEEWITLKFGRKLYETFFKIYTEKVWGIPCNQIDVEWAAQRIKGLDFIQIIKNAIFKNTNKEIKTLVDQFDYPILGAGQMYEAMCDIVVSRGVKIKLGSKVLKFNSKDNQIESIVIINSDGYKEKIYAKQYFSSIPLTHFYKKLSPPETNSIQKAVDKLYYREHITVNLIVNGSNTLFPDQWIYIHSPNVQTARIANYNNFSKAMVGLKDKTALSIEYFVFQQDDLWNETDDTIKALAIDELNYLGLVKKEVVEQSWIVRETESYPVYYMGFQKPYNLVKSRLNQFLNLFPIGRGGLYKYNNQDHSTMSGILAARNYLKPHGPHFNLWNINMEAKYHENGERDNK